jgi:hypothetical protein
MIRPVSRSARDLGFRRERADGKADEKNGADAKRETEMLIWPTR